jgi:hypothetical protein
VNQALAQSPHGVPSVWVHFYNKVCRFIFCY